MPALTIRFELTDGSWVPERESVGFLGKTETGSVEFLITCEAPAHMVNPELDAIDRDMALEAFIEFEVDINRIARLEFVKRLGREPPVLLTAADMG